MLDLLEDGKEKSFGSAHPQSWKMLTSQNCEARDDPLCGVGQRCSTVTAVSRVLLQTGGEEHPVFGASLKYTAVLERCLTLN